MKKIFSNKLDEVGVSHYIKYNQFDREQKRSYQQQAVEWKYDEEVDCYRHPGGFLYLFSHTQYRKTASGFKQEIKVYLAEEPELAHKRDSNQPALSTAQEQRKPSAFIRPRTHHLCTT